MKKYFIDPCNTTIEKTLVREDIPYKLKGNTAVITDEKQFVRAAFHLMLPFLPTEKDFVKGVLL